MDLELHTASSASANFQKEKEELEWLLHSPEISRSASFVRFLSFICNKYFEGAAKDIREYSIAVEALGRKESSFDSHMDPIVRVTARALRKRLCEIYQRDGQHRSLHIVLPLGHYVPQFVRQEDPRGEPDLSRKDADGEEMQTSAAAVFANQSTIWKTASILLAMSGVFLAGLFLGQSTGESSPIEELIPKRRFRWAKR
jgi:hypothetical protein